MRKFALVFLSAILFAFLIKCALAQEEKETTRKDEKTTRAKVVKKSDGKKLNTLKDVMKKTGVSSRRLEKEIKVNFDLVAKQSALIAELAECIQKKFRSDKKFCTNIQMLKASAERMQRAAQKRDEEKVKAEFKNLGMSCAECHKKYKKVGRNKASKGSKK